MRAHGSVKILNNNIRNMTFVRVAHIIALCRCIDREIIWHRHRRTMYIGVRDEDVSGG